jgi:DNA-binding transcriptional LysR family regulator
VARRIDWESQIGRRLKLRDLHVFFTVVQRGSMAKAAAHLGVSQPAVSEIIGDLEHALGVRLLDRNPHGVEPTVYGHALLKRGTVAFDELKQGIRDIECLADPTSGELQIGCPESLAASILPPIVQQFYEQYPGVVLRMKDVLSPVLNFPELRERSVDLVLDRLVKPIAGEVDELNVEVVYEDELVIAAGLHTRWAKRARIDLAELVGEPWILSPPRAWGEGMVTETFRARGLEPPKVAMTTFSVHLRANLLASGPFITAFPKSVLRLNADRFSLKALPVDLPARPWPIALITLKNRSLSPVAQNFIDHLRGFLKAPPLAVPAEQKSA